ncbi:sensor histidine kinase [Streptomyces sp. NPDC059009]|uniref:sensor histidine kinase n=1 Tax=Streptomyces sp. NPDC059009 TaxID=3346694 RepID=UPI0036AE9B59
MCSHPLLDATLRRWGLDRAWPPRRIRPRAADARLWDLATASVALALTLLAVSTRYRTGIVSGPAGSVAMATAYAATLLLRRRIPELAAVTGVAATLVTDDPTPLIFSTWALVRFGGRARLVSVTALALAYVLTRPLLGQPLVSTTVLHQLGVHVVLIAAAAQVLRRQERLNSLFRRQMRRVRGGVDQATRYAVLEERTRLAFDMHDGVGHQVAVVSLQAAAVKVHAERPDKVREGAEVIEEAARAVMAELREILDILRKAPGELSPPARLVDVGYQVFLESLVRNMRAIGVQAACSVEGTPVPLPQQIQSTLYRIGQEGLTNAVKHAPGADIDITLTFDQEWVDISVRNGPRTDAGPALGGTGAGLRNLRTRVHLLGGRFESCSTAAGGFLLSARMPLPED